MFAAINGIWSYKGIPVLYDLTFLLYLKLSEQRGEGKKKGKNRMEKKQRIETTMGKIKEVRKGIKERGIK